MCPDFVLKTNIRMVHIHQIYDLFIAISQSSQSSISNASDVRASTWS